MFKMIIQGRLVEDAQIQQSKDGQSTFLSFRVAVNTFENKSNKAYFVSVSAFNYRSNMVPYLKKGGLVDVIGTPRIDSFLNRQNMPMYDIHLSADSVEFSGNGTGSKAQEAVATQTTEVQQTEVSEPVEEEIIMTTSNSAKKQSASDTAKVNGGNTQKFTASQEQNDDDLPF